MLILETLELCDVFKSKEDLEVVLRGLDERESFKVRTKPEVIHNLLIFPKIMQIYNKIAEAGDFSLLNIEDMDLLLSLQSDSAVQFVNEYRDKLDEQLRALNLPSSREYMLTHSMRQLRQHVSETVGTFFQPASSSDEQRRDGNNCVKPTNPDSEESKSGCVLI